MPAETPISLVKYRCAADGLACLESATLRWSAPHLFGDPFEPAADTKVDFDRESFSESLLRYVVSLIFAREEPSGKNSKLIVAICRWREEGRFSSEEEAEEVLRQLISQMTDTQLERAEDYLAQWREHARSLRIACFCARHTILGCWQRYADGHRGLALRFACGEDTALEHPRPVEYVQIPPQITSLREQIGNFLGRQSAPRKEDFPEKSLQKGKYNQAEGEWRCLDHEQTPEDADPAAFFSDRPFSPADLRAVYLGAAMDSDTRTRVSDLVRSRYPKAKILQAVPVPGKYELDFRGTAED